MNCFPSYVKLIGEGGGKLVIVGVNFLGWGNDLVGSTLMRSRQ